MKFPVMKPTLAFFLALLLPVLGPVLRAAQPPAAAAVRARHAAGEVGMHRLDD
jgi:hypothetical protein